MKNLFRLCFAITLVMAFAFIDGLLKSSTIEFDAKNKPINSHDMGRSGETDSRPTVTFEGLKKINGTEIFCKVIGTSEPLVIVHGGPGLAHDYRY